MDDKAKIKAKIKAACVVMGCKEKDLLHSRLRGETVILIVGPVGYKHIVPFADLAAPPPVTTRVEAEKEPVSARRSRTGSKSKAN